MSETKVVTHTSWFSRMWSSAQGVVIGLLLIVISIFLMFWNERRAVITYQSLQEGAQQVISITTERINPEHDNKLVHLSGLASASATLRDDTFFASHSALKLRRTVEMYQWDEQATTKTVEKLGGGTETTSTYTYEKRWSDTLIDSTKFQNAASHQNPTSKPYENQEWVTETAMIGTISIPQEMIGQLSNYQPLPITADWLAALRAARQGPITPSNDILYLGSTQPESPAIGDTRIRYEVVPHQVISVIAQQRGTTLQPYQTRSGRQISLLEVGSKPASDMFQSAIQSNSVTTMVLRVVATLLIFIGLKMLLRPLQVLASVIPLFGKLIGTGITFTASILTVLIAAVTITLSWIAARPIIASVSLLFVIILLVIYARWRSARAAR